MRVRVKGQKYMEPKEHQRSVELTNRLKVVHKLGLIKQFL